MDPQTAQGAHGTHSYVKGDAHQPRTYARAGQVFDEEVCDGLEYIGVIGAP